MRILITSGGTKVPIDKVRDITNMSNGTFGSRIAHEALVAGHDITFLCAKHSKSPFAKTLDYKDEGHWDQDLNEWAAHWNFCEQYRSQYTETRFRNFDDYAQWLEHCVQMGQPDVVILAAAVSDNGVENYVDGKIRTGDSKTIALFDLPKLIHRVKKWKPDCMLVGFKFLVDSTDEELIQSSLDSIAHNGCDLVVANDLRDLKADNHRLLVCDQDQNVRTYRKNDSKEPNYLAAMVMEEVRKCHAKYYLESPAA